MRRCPSCGVSSIFGIHTEKCAWCVKRKRGLDRHVSFLRSIEGFKASNVAQA